MNNRPGMKMILAFVVAFSMILPALAFVSLGVGEQQTVSDIEVSGDRAYAQIGNNHFEVWIGGGLYDAYLMFSRSSDGIQWTKPVQITDNEFLPFEVQMSAGSGSIHIAWLDTISKMQRACHMSYDLGSDQWSKANIFQGAYPELATEGNKVLVVTTGNGLNLYLSQDDGQSFEKHTVLDTLFCNKAAASIDGGTVYLAFSGGEYSQADGKTLDQGIRTASFDIRSQTVSNLRKIADTDTMITDVFMDQDNEVAWTEYSEPEKLDAETQPATKAPSKLPPKKWTFISYLDADDGVLDTYGTEDLNEMEMVGSNADLNIIVLIDNLGTGNTHAYYVEHDTNMGAINSLEIPLSDINPGWGTELNMGDPQTAIDFFNYVYANYPADRYMLDMWDHGGTWDWGMCLDASTGDRLTSLEVRTIYETVRADTGQKTLFDVAGYDECVMADASLY
ncbi:MAG: hypothetical protein KAJ33_08290, partial [Thermoplasmata archaeon]|nr:hypothetical protein [Thermoplasmata archaeon]